MEVGWQPQEEVIVRKKGGLRKERAKEVAKSLRGLRKVHKTIHKEKSHKERARFQDAIKKKKKEMQVEDDKGREAAEEEGAVRKQEEEAMKLDRQILKQIERPWDPEAMKVSRKDCTTIFRTTCPSSSSTRRQAMRKAFRAGSQKKR